MSLSTDIKTILQELKPIRLPETQYQYRLGDNPVNCLLKHNEIPRPTSLELPPYFEQEQAHA